ncbi:unnamed protein product [Thelazia callipaeda]|uniref:Uncharacterized protein n=1 Tax=Thelazia callipaeda TaxID=103827 RepID=A0A0N5CNS3_THECL|nr:unnamed protein product [Thelazia callipaeda]
MGARSPLTPIGTDIESVIIAVAMFMTCGLLMFACCFVVTQIYVCYKRGRLLKKRRSKQLDEEFQFAVMQTDAISFGNHSL